MHHPLVHAWFLTGAFIVSLLPLHLMVGLETLVLEGVSSDPLAFSIGVLLSGALFFSLFTRCRRAWATSRGVELSSPRRFVRWREILRLRWVYGGLWGAVYCLELRDGSSVVFGGSQSTPERFWKMRPARRARKRRKRDAREALHADGTVLCALVVLGIAGFLIGLGPELVRALQHRAFAGAAGLALCALLLLVIGARVVATPSVYSTDQGLVMGRRRPPVPWRNVRAVVSWLRGMDGPHTIWFNDGTPCVTFFGSADAKIRIEQRRRRHVGSSPADSRSHGPSELFRA